MNVKPYCNASERPHAGQQCDQGLCAVVGLLCSVAICLWCAVVGELNCKCEGIHGATNATA